MTALELRAIDAILALIALEGVGLIVWRARMGSGPQPAALIGNLVAGGALLMALRESLAGASAALLGATLALAFAAHVFDLAKRWTWREPPVRETSSRLIADFTPPAGTSPRWPRRA